MPVETCTVNSKSGFRYGSSGKCYSHDGSDAGKAAAKKKAVRQAIAIGGGDAPKDLSEVELAAVSMKTCKSCDKARPVSRFPEDGRTSDGRSVTCVTCRFGTNHSDSRSYAAELETRDMNGVELLSAGGPYFGEGSPEEGDFFDVDYLKTLAANAEALKGEVDAPIKIGHSKGQRLLKNSGLFVDEQPAAGWIENQRVSGNKLLGDLKKVPAKIADLIDVGAFRKRSVELSKVKSQTKDGEEFEVISALALLGAKAPAVRTLNDIVTAWYAEGDYDHMEETVRLLLADVENDTGARTFAQGDVIWDSENGSQDWQQDLTAALNANVTPSDGNDLSQPYYVQEIDQINRKAIVCDWRSNTYWVVPFSIGGGADSDDPVPAPFEQWTLAEQAWVEAANEAAQVGSESFAQHTQISAGTGDTRSEMAETVTKTEQTDTLSDEQVTTLAETFGIEETDAEKRRAAVLAKFAELSPKQESGGEGGSGDDGKPDGDKGEPAVAAATADGVTLSQVEKDKLFADAQASRTFMENATKSRIEANLKAAHRMGKIEAKDFGSWRGFMEREYDLAVDALAKLPISRELLVAYGSDESGDGAKNKDEEIYRQYAAMTHVPVREKEKAA